MNEKKAFIKSLSDGKSQIIKDMAFCLLLNGQIPHVEKPFTELFAAMDEQVQLQDGRITRGWQGAPPYHQCDFALS